MRRRTITDTPPSLRSPGKEELFEAIVSSSTDFAIFTVNPFGITTSWNVGAFRLFGFSEAEMIGRNSDAIFTAADRNAGVPQAERERARLSGSAVDERWHQRKDGSRFWASGLLMPLQNAKDGFVKIARDRTEQHRADEQLQQSEERFRVLATSIPQLVFRTMPDGDRTWGSPQWIDFTGLSLDDSLRFGWLDAVHPEDRDLTQAAWKEARETREYYVEHRIRRQADGEYRWHQMRARPLDDPAFATGEWVGTMTDIHELRGMKDRQDVLMAELQHRTRNLLAVVQAIASQTIRKSQSFANFGPEFESRLGALSRVQSLLARLDHADVNLHTLIDAELVAHADGQLGTDKIVVDGPAVNLPAISAQALGLALHELATNAVKYGALAQSGGRLSVTWRVETEAAKPVVALEWKESSVSMPIGVAPRRKGYGSELIERALPYQLSARTRLEFRHDGVRCEIRVPITTQQLEASHAR
ncbi:MAG: sensor histidine kinase protein [Sphingomonadales bacterium]|nr:sensor histidine kinase protein [Sphingomonadales bacterium]